MGGDEMGKILNKKQMTEEDIKLHYITPSIMRRYENVITDVLLRICEALNCNLQYIVERVLINNENKNTERITDRRRKNGRKNKCQHWL